MRRTTVLLGCALLLACAPDPSEPDSSVAIIARASLLLEPPTIGLGDVTTAVLLVTTAPNHRVLPPVIPEVPGVWILESLTDPTHKRSTRWLHRTRIRLRPREAGSYVFPAGQVTIESEAGEQQTLRFAEREFEVVSILPRFPDRTAPFGLQHPAPGTSTRQILLFAGIGAALALIGVTIFSRLRRKRAVPPTPEPARDAEAESLLEWSKRELAGAFDALERDPRSAVNHAAHFVRHYAESRFRTTVAAASTEELAGRTPPLAAHAYWPELVAVLRRLDELRWRPASSARASSEEAQRARDALDAARVFLERSSPEARR